MYNSKREQLKGIATGAILAIILISGVPAFARVAQETITVNFNNISIAVNGQYVQTEHEAFIFQGRTYLPVRDVADAMGFDVTWEDSTNTVHLTERTNPMPQTQGQADNRRNNRPANPAITLDIAIEIAYEYLADREITAAFHGDRGMDWELEQWVWELEFRSDPNLRGRGYDIEFYINVHDGSIVKFERH